MTRVHHGTGADVEWINVSELRRCPICGGMAGCKTQAEGHFAVCGTEPSEWPLTVGGWLHRVLRSSAHGMVQEGAASRSATSSAINTLS
jgi:hypothetical protein